MDNMNEKRAASAATRRQGRQEWLQTWVFPFLRLMFPVNMSPRVRPAVMRIVAGRTPRRQ